VTFRTLRQRHASARRCRAFRRREGAFLDAALEPPLARAHAGGGRHRPQLRPRMISVPSTSGATRGARDADALVLFAAG
jgi:hypothetical protein